MALYPVQRLSSPHVEERHTRVPLDAAEDVIGLGLIFPPPDDPNAVEYLSADLSQIVTIDELEPGEESAEEDEAAA